jgi:hypothetical protein
VAVGPFEKHGPREADGGASRLGPPGLMKVDTGHVPGVCARFAHEPPFSALTEEPIVRKGGRGRTAPDISRDWREEKRWLCYCELVK